jgi:predicted  nucleic acid-binding Zn-ribbon protein
LSAQGPDIAPAEQALAGAAAEQEIERLRARVATLEQELLEVQAQANAAVAHWQERAYWLERWHLDLNALMRRRGASELRGLLRALRSVKRAFVRAKRAILR